jgi:hypothetical protein
MQKSHRGWCVMSAQPTPFRTLVNRRGHLVAEFSLPSEPTLDVGNPLKKAAPHIALGLVRS